MTKTVTSMAAVLAFMAISAQASAVTNHNVVTSQKAKQNYKIETTSTASQTRTIKVLSLKKKTNSGTIRNMQFSAPVNTRTVVITTSQGTEVTPNLFQPNS